MDVSARHDTIDGRETRTGEDGFPARRARYKPFMWMRRRFLPVLSILICVGFILAVSVLVVGLLSANYQLLGLVFWALPRLGFLALVVLLVRFVTAP